MHASTRGSLASLQFLGILETLDRIGIESASVLAACGLTRARLLNPLSRLDAALDHTFWAAVERSAADPAIGLKLGVEIAKQGRRGVDTYIALNAGTLRDVLVNTDRFAKIADDRGHVELRETDALATVRLYRDGGYPRADGYVDWLFAASVFNLRQRAPDFRVSRVRLRRPPPKDPGPYLAPWSKTRCVTCSPSRIHAERWSAPTWSEACSTAAPRASASSRSLQAVGCEAALASEWRPPESRSSPAECFYEASRKSSCLRAVLTRAFSAGCRMRRSVVTA